MSLNKFSILPFRQLNSIYTHTHSVSLACPHLWYLPVTDRRLWAAAPQITMIHFKLTVYN